MYTYGSTHSVVYKQLPGELSNRAGREEEGCGISTAKLFVLGVHENSIEGRLEIGTRRRREIN